MTREIRLSKMDWWQDVERQGLPSELVSLLWSLISATLTACIQPTATSNLIALAKEHLVGGILIGDEFYDVMVYVPDNPNSTTMRAFFVLVPKYSSHKLTYLNEMPESR